jgi:Mn2+/Fe2+ NRAMP family transporter
MGASIVLIPNLPLIKVMWFSQIVNCLLLPVILIFMLMLVNKKELMGDYRNSLWMNIVTYLSTALIIVLNLVLFYNAFADIMR